MIMNVIIHMTLVKAYNYTHTHTHTANTPRCVCPRMHECVPAQWKINTAHNVSILCTQHHTVHRVCRVEAAYEAEHDVMFVRSTGDKPQMGAPLPTTSAIDRVKGKG